MSSIIARPRRDGTIGYTAQIKIKRGGKVVFSQAQTFDREQAAKAWLVRKRRELAQPGAIEAAGRPEASATVGDAIARYLDKSGASMGRTKIQALGALQDMPIASIRAADVRSHDIVALAEMLRVHRKPQTVGNYLSHLAAVFAVARTAWGYPLDRNAMDDAIEACRRIGLTGRSERRDRRPTLDELNRLMAYFYDAHRRRPRYAPMHRIVAFAIFSTRRQEEITRLRWADLEPGRVLVRDMKHPDRKHGNHQWVTLPQEAEAIARAMPQTGPLIFPFGPDGISIAFTRACRMLEIPDLRFHDLRHEGVSRLFEMGLSIPQVAEVSGHRSWTSLQRYTHIRQAGDKFSGWPWIPVVASPETQKTPPPG